MIPNVSGIGYDYDTRHKSSHRQNFRKLPFQASDTKLVYPGDSVGAVYAEKPWDQEDNVIVPGPTERPTNIALRRDDNRYLGISIKDRIVVSPQGSDMRFHFEPDHEYNDAVVYLHRTKRREDRLLEQIAPKRVAGEQQATLSQAMRINGLRGVYERSMNENNVAEAENAMKDLHEAVIGFSLAMPADSRRKQLNVLSQYKNVSS